MNSKVRQLSSIIILCILSIISCTGNKNQPSQDTGDSIAKKDSIKDSVSTTVKRKCKYNDISISVDSFAYTKYNDYPADSFYVKGTRTGSTGEFYVIVPHKSISSVLRDSVMAWIRGNFDGKYTGDLNDCKSMFKFYMQKHMEDDNYSGNDNIDYDTLSADDREYYTTTYQMCLLLDCITKNFVTYNCELYIYFAGAVHGMSGIWGQTFFKKDGSRFGWNMFKNKNSAKLKRLIWNGLLEQYYNGDKEAMKGLLVKESDLPLPAVDPYLTKNGITFVYSEYEISTYADRHPMCTISLDKMKEFLSDKANKILR